MKTLIALLLLLVTIPSYSQSTDFKHDFGLRLSTYQPETFQLQYRFHLNEKWAFSASAHFGSRSRYYNEGEYLIQDSLYELYSTAYHQRTYGIDLGAVRKLSFMKHKFYYVGGSVGVGTTAYSTHNERMVYTPILTDPTFTYGIGIPPPIDEIVDSEYHATVRNTLHVKSRLFTGVDVPIVDRLTFNFELGIMFDMEFDNMYHVVYGNIPGYLRGGIRYRFGKIDS